MNIIDLNFIEKQIDFSVFNSIYAGFSGGADSTALLVILKTLSEKHKFQLTAVHLEHGLRGKEGLNDALCCKKFCKKQNINYLEFKLNVKGSLLPGEGVEACARRLRLDKFSEIINEHKSPVSVCCATPPQQAKSPNAIALGHHQDDKIENLFIRLFRGSNSSGLTSLRHSTIFNGLNILRPLLNISKDEIEHFLHSNNITDWNIDSTNQENLYRRNIIRNKILSELYHSIPESKAGILRAEEALKDDAEYLEHTSIKEYSKFFTSSIEFPKSISTESLLNMHTAIRARVLRYWLTDLLEFDFIPNHCLLSRIDSDLKRQPKEIVLIPLFENAFLKLEKGYLSLNELKSQSNLKPCVWNWKDNPKIQIGNYYLEARTSKKSPSKMMKTEESVYFDSSLIPDTLCIRPWKEGDNFTPFGSDHPIKVKRVFKNNKTSPNLRKQFPMLCLPDDSIIWVAGLNRSNFAPVIKSATKVVLFSVSKEIIS